ncbi:transposase, partial [Lacticaseibacillus paracasei]|uniref:transposase n=1 Tax=Lacticaseibacillus paracasei TaxID=1597 RepID=UPI003C130290
DQLLKDGFVVNTILKEADLFCPNSVRINFTIYRIKTYYCHAYTPAERGSNERFNRNLRYFYPKGTRFEHISAQDLTTTLLQINQRPLKILDWQTPYQVMLTNLSKNSD